MVVSTFTVLHAYCTEFIREVTMSKSLGGPANKSH
jgi:hypothetical protein